IGSGELVGPVGYLVPKLKAAKESGVGTVLVPYEQEYIGNTNVSVNLSEYGKELGIRIIEVQTLEEAIIAFTNQPPQALPKNLTIAPAYAETMHAVAAQLCNRSIMLQELAQQLPLPMAEQAAEEAARNSTAHGLSLLAAGRSYSAASLCFGANLRYSADLLRLGSMQWQHEMIQRDIVQLREYAEQYPIRTMTDLETFMVVMDRLVEAEDSLNVSATFAAEGNTSESAESLAYALERVNSAYAWSQFFGKPGKRFRFSQQRLSESCIAKLSEAREHLDYLHLFLPGLLLEIEEDLGRAFADYEAGKPALCLSRASLAKAQVNSVLSSIGIEDVQRYLDIKLGAAERLLRKNQQEGIFPLLGYSYYTYAQDLREENPTAASLYAEYALELANLDIYFPDMKINLGVLQWREPLLLLAGLIIGILIARTRYEPRKR
ncbi:MAG TPA: hypothetical protein VJK52_04730, partial [Candidatus Nanoarchaeia archaeon]|nr:hypothetical protein [Candidatus Nanoarchaeia archaeon]